MISGRTLRTTEHTTTVNITQTRTVNENESKARSTRLTTLHVSPVASSDRHNIVVSTDSSFKTSPIATDRSQGRLNNNSLPSLTVSKKTI